jgi:hypothetical protein
LTIVEVDRVQAPAERAPTATAGSPVERQCHASHDDRQHDVLDAERPFALIRNGQQNGGEKPGQEQ